MKTVEVEKVVSTVIVLIYVGKTKTARHQIYAKFVHIQLLVQLRETADNVILYEKYYMLLVTIVALDYFLPLFDSISLICDFAVCEMDEDCTGDRICEEFGGNSVCCQPFQGKKFIHMRTLMKVLIF